MSASFTDRQKTVIATMLAAIIVPRVQRWTGVTLTLSDVADLMVAAAMVWHGVASFIESRWPPVPQPLQNPTPPTSASASPQNP